MDNFDQLILKGNQDNKRDIFLIDGAENVQQFVRVSLGDALEEKLREWQQKERVPGNIVYQAVQDTRLYQEILRANNNSERAEAFLRKFFYPLAEDILKENDFVQKENVWYYRS